MTSLIDKTPEAEAWLDSEREALSSLSAYGRIQDAVLWTGELTDAGVPIVDIDPQKLVDEINSRGMPLLFGHDPSAPRGRVLAARLFKSPSEVPFVAAIIGLYTAANCLSFEGLGATTLIARSPPELLPMLPPQTSFSIATDPREVDEAWVSDVATSSPFPVERVEMSHNAAEAATELIRLALPYVVLVWNPFVTEIAKAAGKDVYAGVRDWLRTVVAKVSKRSNPILAIDATQDGCQVTFILRGNNVNEHYAALGQLAEAAVQAAQLITHLKESGLVPRTLVYEFDTGAARWAPANAILEDGRLVTSKATLIAIEQAPMGLSIGMSRTP